MDKIKLDLYFKDEQYMLDNYKAKELKEFCKEHGIHVSGNKTQLVNRMKDYLEECRQTIAYYLVYDFVKDVIETSRSKDEFIEKLNTIDDELLRDCYSKCGEEYDRSKMLKYLCNDNYEGIDCLDKYWTGEDIVINEGDIIIDWFDYSVIRDGVFYSIAFASHKYYYPYSLIADNISEELEEYKPFKVYKVLNEIKTKLIDINTIPKKIIRYNIIDGNSQEFYINGNLEITVGDLNDNSY